MGCEVRVSSRKGAHSDLAHNPVGSSPQVLGVPGDIPLAYPVLLYLRHKGGDAS